MSLQNKLTEYNPDILDFISSISNDAIATPPQLANKMLDSLQEGWQNSFKGESIWSRKDLTFLDPVSKSGVFLREIVKRLNIGLAKEIPDIDERIYHILTKQIFGIGITELNTLMSKRTVYCSRDVKSEHSIYKSSDKDLGNILYKNRSLLEGWQNFRNRPS